MIATIQLCALVLCVLVAGATAERVDDSSFPQTARQTFACGSRCRFIFCRSVGIFFFGAPKRPSGPLICRRNQDIGQILKTGQAMVFPEGGTPTKISEWSPPGLTDPFPRRYFRTGSLPDVENGALARAPSKGNQNDIINNVCFTLPIKQYERITPNGVKVINTSQDPDRDCLAFTARTDEIVLTAQWFSSDDLDLTIIEPDGTVLDGTNRRSKCGRRGPDNGVDVCDIDSPIIERAAYSRACPDFQSGMYKAVLRHVNSCGEGPTPWEVRVTIDGRLNKIRTGTSSLDGGAKITTLKFTL